MKLYQILECFIKCGEAFEIRNDGNSLNDLPEKMCSDEERNTIIGTSALGVHDISIKNKTEEYKWTFNMDHIPSEFDAWSVTKCISIGIINTNELNINILNINAQKVATYGRLYGVIKDLASD